MSGRSLPKSPTGIAGLDEIKLGGLPKGLGRRLWSAEPPVAEKRCSESNFWFAARRSSVKTASASALKRRPKIFAANVASLGFDLAKLQRAKKLAIDYIYIEKNEIAETGEYDLEGLFVRLNSAIDSVNAKRVLLDTPEALVRRALRRRHSAL